MKRILILGGFLLCVFMSSAQTNTNNYKYVVVPKGYEFLKKEDAYQLNSLTKFLFNKYGFVAFLQGENVPSDLAENGCKGLRADVKKSSSLFLTKLTVSLTDCNGAVLFTSDEGQSKEKDFKTAYHEALRNAFKSVEKLNHQYVEGEANSVSQAKVPKQDKAVKPEVKKEALVNGSKPVKESTENEENKSSKTVMTDKDVSYSLNNIAYVFDNTAYGFELSKKQSDGKKLVGKIYKLGKDNSYLVKAEDLSGFGYFDSYGNFILERINPATELIIKDVLARQ